MDTGELELVELKFPSMYSVGTYVKVVQIVDVARPWATLAIPAKVKGQVGFVQSHRSHHGQRWHRVTLGNGGYSDFLTQELQRYE